MKQTKQSEGGRSVAEAQREPLEAAGHLWAVLFDWLIRILSFVWLLRPDKIRIIIVFGIDFSAPIKASNVSRPPHHHRLMLFN